MEVIVRVMRKGGDLLRSRLPCWTTSGLVFVKQMEGTGRIRLNPSNASATSKTRCDLSENKGFFDKEWRGLTETETVIFDNERPRIGQTNDRRL